MVDRLCRDTMQGLCLTGVEMGVQAMLGSSQVRGIIGARPK